MVLFVLFCLHYVRHHGLTVGVMADCFYHDREDQAILAGATLARVSLNKRKRLAHCYRPGSACLFFWVVQTNEKADIFRFAGARVVAYGQLRRALGSWRRRRVSHQVEVAKSGGVTVRGVI